MENNYSNDASHVFHFFLNREYISIANAKGIYLYDIKGNKYIDASGGPILCNLGHGLKEMAKVIGDQAGKVSYVHRFFIFKVQYIKKLYDFFSLVLQFIFLFLNLPAPKPGIYNILPKLITRHHH